jgi:hypothetical protein
MLCDKTYQNEASRRSCCAVVVIVAGSFQAEASVIVVGSI